MDGRYTLYSSLAVAIGTGRPQPPALWSVAPTSQPPIGRSTPTWQWCKQGGDTAQRLPSSSPSGHHAAQGREPQPPVGLCMASRPGAPGKVTTRVRCEAAPSSGAPPPTLPPPPSYSHLVRHPDVAHRAPSPAVLPRVAAGTVCDRAILPRAARHGLPPPRAAHAATERQIGTSGGFRRGCCGFHCHFKFGVGGGGRGGGVRPGRGAPRSTCTRGARPGGDRHWQRPIPSQVAAERHSVPAGHNFRLRHRRARRAAERRALLRW